MPVIDLNSGKITQDAPDISGQLPPPEPVSQKGGVIDLDTGKFVSSAPAEPATDVSAIPLASSLEEIGSAEQLNQLSIPSFLASVGSMFTFQDNEVGDILKDQFPGTKIDPDVEGNLVATFPDGKQFAINKPGVSGQDIVKLIGSIGAFTPAAKGATIGKTLAQKVAAGVAGAGATETAIQTGQEALGAEFTPSDVALSAGLGGVAEVVVPAIQAVRGARQAKQVGAERATVEQAEQAIKPAQEAVAGLKEATGAEVGLFQAQQTQIPSDLLKQRILPQLDAGSRKAASSLEAQNKEAFEATSELINTIAGPETVSAGAGKFRTASQLAIDSAKQSRKVATQDLYSEALSEGAKVNLGSTKELIKDMLDEAPKGSDFERIGKQLSRLIKPLKKGEPPSLRQLQKSKQAMQDIVDTVGDKAVSGPIKFDVVNIKRELVDQMSEASPLFRAAEDEFIRLSPAVKELEDSILGAAAKVNDIDLQSISSRIFAKNSNPETVKNAKKLIDNVDPEAWNVMLRGELQKRFGGIKTLAEDLPGELVGNVPGQLRRAIFGNPEQRRTLLAAMNTDQRKNFVYLDEVLRRASSGRQAGSPTASFGAALDKLRGVGGVLRDAIFRPLETLQKTGESGLFDRNVAALTEVLFDPKFKPQLSKLRKLDPNSPAAGRALTQLLDDITITEESE